jgi:Alpha-2-macroglobulin family
VPTAKLRPGSELTVNIESAAKSTVALLGIDESVTYLRKGNDIDSETVIKDLLLYGHTDFSEPLQSSVIAGNGFIFIEDFTDMHPCTDAELQLLNTQGDLLDERFGESPEDYEIQPALDSDDDPDEARIRKDFREVFIFDQVKMGRKSDAIFKTKLPDTVTTWHLTGFSMNREAGFALADPVKVVTIQNLFIKLHLPYSIKFGEILKVDVTVFSFIKSNRPITVNVTIHNSVDDEDQFNIMNVDKCKATVLETDDGQDIRTLKVPQNSAATTSFYIQALKSGTIKIKVTANSNKGKDAIEKTLLVEHEGTTYYDTENVICDLTSDDRFSREVEFTPSMEVIPQSIKFQALVSGNNVPVLPAPRSKLGMEFVQKLV